MRVRIHRGAHEIGGNCVEVESGDGSRIVLDVGRPLDAPQDADVELPDVVGLGEEDGSMLGVLISHAHQDHWGLVDQVRAGVPIYMGEATANILREAAFWSRGLEIEPAGFLVHREPFELGPFRITPFLNDHSAFDAYSLLVEVDGKRLFYTGDIRGHGRKAGIFEELLREPPEDVDVLLMEGTHIPAGDLPADPGPSETDLERQFVDDFGTAAGLALVVSSAQNIDRLVTIYRAALQAGRELVVDLYTASIAWATGNANIPQPGEEWPRVHVYVPHWQRVRVKERGEFDRVAAVKPYRLFEGDLAEDPSKYVLLFSLSGASRLADAKALNGAKLFWSLWKGYLDGAGGQRLRAFLEQHDIPLALRHSSGHAYLPDLKRLAAAIAPGRVVPIHSFGGDSFGEHFPDVVVRPDGVWWEV